jgi:peptidoglycan-N-acetylglucosamine deacetylase
VLARWIDSFNFAYERCQGGAMTWTLHPQTIGRAHNLLMLEKFLDHISSFDGVWFPTLSELFDCWRDDGSGQATAAAIPVIERARHAPIYLERTTP